jgi:hypothetical protein
LGLASIDIPLAACTGSGGSKPLIFPGVIHHVGIHGTKQTATEPALSARLGLAVFRVATTARTAVTKALSLSNLLGSSFDFGIG